MIEVLFQVRKDKFKDHPAIPETLDLVEEEEQITHFLTLDEVRRFGPPRPRDTGANAALACLGWTELRRVRVSRV